jgi:oligoribonuclease NrnB/cAMP/cGMP phosphodiesterase (DHH superfamily)
MNIYHLSHIDLDGYGCQYLVNACFSEHANYKLESYNANYGPEVKARLEEIISSINREKFVGHGNEHLILVTDLNLTTKEARWLEEQAMNVGAKIQLLDHHGSGQKTSEQYAWYYLDTKRCATLITYDWLKTHYEFDQESEFEQIVKAINAIDIWVSDDELFECGKVGLGMISGSKEINRTLFPNNDRAYKLSLIDAMKVYTLKEDAHIALDNDLHQIRKSFFLKDKDNTKDNLAAMYLTELLTEDKQRLTIEYRGKKGLLGYSLGNTSILGNTFLVENPDYDFYMDVNWRGNFSLRSNNKLDVSKMAEEIGNGGGHPNASGGKIKDFKDSFVYSDIRSHVQDYITEKTT